MSHSCSPPAGPETRPCLRAAACRRASISRSAGPTTSHCVMDHTPCISFEARRVVPRHYLKSAGRSARRRAHIDYGRCGSRVLRRRAGRASPRTSRAAERHEDAPQNFIAVRIPGDDPAAGAVLYIDHIGQRRVLEDLNNKGVARFGQVVRRERRGRSVRAAH